jgi:hypothetical protein
MNREPSPDRPARTPARTAALALTLASITLVAALGACSNQKSDVRPKTEGGGPASPDPVMPARPPSPGHAR